jgi:hypothetical protein
MILKSSLQLSHQLKELTETEFTYLATNLSDMELFESLLDPLLIPRLPGTPNHTIVKEVSLYTSADNANDNNDTIRKVCFTHSHTET